MEEDAENLLDKNWREDSQILREKYNAEVEIKEGVYPLRRKANEKKMDKLKDELKTEFDPIKTALKDQIKDKISEDNYFIQFQDLEEDKDFLQEVKYLLSNPALIGEESIEKHPSPVFVDNEPLEAATHHILKYLQDPGSRSINSWKEFSNSRSGNEKSQQKYEALPKGRRELLIRKRIPFLF